MTIVADAEVRDFKTTKPYSKMKECPKKNWEMLS
jgi:hypothetical protein